MRANQAESARRGRAGGRQRAAAAGCLWPTEHESVRPFFSFFFFFFFQLVLTLLLFLTIYLKLPRAGDMSLFFLPSLHICTLQHLIHSTEYSTHTHTVPGINPSERICSALPYTHTHSAAAAAAAAHSLSLYYYSGQSFGRDLLCV
jgi:hypothetical protein